MSAPFIDVLSQTPRYANVLKEILSKKKRKMDERKTIVLGEESNVIVINTLPAKLKDPSNFSILCLIGNVCIDRSLYDLGSSVNLMPYSIFKRLDLGEL